LTLRIFRLVRSTVSTKSANRPPFATEPSTRGLYAERASTMSKKVYVWNLVAKDQYRWELESPKNKNLGYGDIYLKATDNEVWFESEVWSPQGKIKSESQRFTSLDEAKAWAETKVLLSSEGSTQRE
jgi:hypothetical protein